MTTMKERQDLYNQGMNHKDESAVIRKGAEMALEAILQEMDVGCQTACKHPLLLAGRFRKVVAELFEEYDDGSQIPDCEMS